MANINANIRSDGIQVFPTVNSRDNGKILLEENISEIVTRITKLNFIYSDHMNTSINIAGNLGKTHFFFLDRSVPFKCNINGYDIIMDPFPSIHLFFNTDSDISVYENPESALIKVQSLVIDTEDVQLFDISKDWENEYLKDNEDINYEYPIGLVLSRMANTNRLKGDKYSSNNRYHYYGVEVKAGSELLDTDERDRLILGWLYFKDLESICNGSLIRGEINKKCFFIIDGDTVIINNQSLTDQFVAKSGNNFHDTEEILHDSDIYGSLMFRDGKTAEDYNIEIGFNRAHSGIWINNPSGEGVINLVNSQIQQDHYVEFNLDKFLIRQDNQDNEGNNSTDKEYLSIYCNPNKTNTENDALIQIFEPTIIYPNDEIERNNPNDFPDDKFATKFDKDRVSFHYNDDSLIDIRCDEDTSRISFGEYETSPMFIDYIVANKDLSINDLLGSVGTVKFCDGKCVDQEIEPLNVEGKPYYNPNFKKYNYVNTGMPKEYSETINVDEYSFIRYEYLDQDSKFEISKIPKSTVDSFLVNEDDRILIFVVDLRNYDSTIGTPELNKVETRYGFYINKDGILTPSHGAFDTDSNGNFITPPASYSYIDAHNESTKTTEQSPGVMMTTNGAIKTYDYISCKYEIPENLFDQSILITNIASKYEPYLNNNDLLDKNNLNKDYINLYFCRDLRSDEDSSTSDVVPFGYIKSDNSIENNPSINTPMKYYKIIKTSSFDGNLKSVLNYSDLFAKNKMINVPGYSDNFKSGEKLYLMISTHLITHDGSSIKDVDGQKVIDYKYTYTPNSIKRNVSVGRGVTGRGIVAESDKDIGIISNPIYVEISRSNLNEETDNYYSLKEPICINQYFRSYLVFEAYSNNYNEFKSYNLKINYNYTTSKSYKSFRFHGYYLTYAEDVPIDSTPVSENNKYKYERFQFELGFELSEIKIEKINDITIKDHPNVNSLYKLYRSDGKPILFNDRYHKLNYFYTSSLNINDKISNEDSEDIYFEASNNDYKNGYEIIPDTKSVFSYDYYIRNDYNTQGLEIGRDNYTGMKAISFSKNLKIIHSTGINFNVGQNKFKVNVDAYFNEILYANKIMFGEDDEFSTTIDENLARFVYKNVDNEINTYTIDFDGITFHKNPEDPYDKDIVISKLKDENSDFNGLNISGDLRADRVFNAVYNDYADNLKCSNVSNYEPGDIICKDPFSDEYVISNYDLRHLVVGVYSDTYGHLLGGDKDKSISENSKNYVPVAVAGNVRVKVRGFVNIGDLIEVSNIPGVGQSAKNPELGTIIGKALETKDSSDIERILMQVMLL